MLKIAALVVAAATTTQSPTAQSAATQSPATQSPGAQSPALVSTAPWWEKVTVTLSGDGKAQSCKYETNLRVAAASSCDVSGGSATPLSSSASARSGSKSELTRITFERRFAPGGPNDIRLNPGDTLLGKQVMALAIDSAGSVEGCKVVARSGDMTPDYGCTEAQAEKFESIATKAAAGVARQGFMTVLVYGHEEHLA